MDTSHRIIRSLLLMGGFLVKTGNRITEEYGLTQQQFVLLSEIVENKEVNQKQLVGKLLLEKSNVSKVVKKLQSAELITVSRSPWDMRTTVLKPTSKGEDLWGACMEKLNSWNNNCLRELQEEERNDAIKALKRLEELIVHGKSSHCGLNDD